MQCPHHFDPEAPQDISVVGVCGNKLGTLLYGETSVAQLCKRELEILWV
jgi:hypothetical protein